jgi:hypothetical protein
VRDIKEGRVLESEKSANGKPQMDPESGELHHQEHAPVHAAAAAVAAAQPAPAQVFSADVEKQEAKTGLALYLSKAKNQAMKGTTLLVE